MQHATITKPEASALQSRLQMLWERTNEQSLWRLAHGEPPVDGGSVATAQDYGDWVDTCLMAAFKATGDSEVFALLFERNQRSFLQAIRGQLRRGQACIDACDVLQEVFLSIYRYPHRFQADRANAFRSWGHRIVHNTVIRFFKGQARQPSPLVIDDEQQRADSHALPPERVAAEHEGAELVNRAYVLFLALYLHQYERLRAREQRVLTLAEVDGRCYRDIARELGVPFANVKMTVFRSRQRIHRGMAEALAALERMEFDAADGPRCVVVRKAGRHPSARTRSPRDAAFGARTASRPRR